MTPDPGLILKQQEFNAAMDRYENGTVYTRFTKAVSLINVGLQAILLYLALPLSIGPKGQAAALILSLLAADFINGWIHLVMDNNDDYSSWAGPLVAAFHLHHRTPQYKINPLPLVYFNETGSKVWLVPFLGLSAALVGAGFVHPVAAYVLLYTGILSSVAEISHYCCHVPDTRVPQVLRRFGLFMGKEHHALHHVKDNTHYAFLNGVTNPLLNLIAVRAYPGYKNTTDLHYALYTGRGTENRGAA